MKEPSNVDEIVEEIEKNDIELIRFLHVDNDNVIRGKEANAKDARREFSSGIEYLGVMPVALTAFDGLVPNTKYGCMSSILLMPDIKTFRILPYSKKAAAVICDQRITDKDEMSPMDPRPILKEFLSKIEYKVKGAFENEFGLFKRRDDGSIVPLDTCDEGPLATQMLSRRMTKNNDLILEMMDMLGKQGIDVEHYIPEASPALHEITISPQDGIRVADSQVMYRETIKSVAWNHGIIASFMPKPFNDLAGHGAHLHLSLWDGDTNIFFSKTDKYGISQEGYYFIGGLLKHLKPMLAFTAACPNSYKRLIPLMYAGAYICYGYKNREAAIRIPPIRPGQEKTTTNLEVKSVDGSAQPYLALGSIVAAGIDGIRKKIDPGVPLQVDPGYLTDKEREERNIERFPETFGDVLRELENDTFFRTVWGDEFIDEYLKLKKYVWTTYHRNVTQWERDAYLECF